MPPANPQQPVVHFNAHMPRDQRLTALDTVVQEAGGLTAEWDDPRVTSVRIPMRGTADSLNVSVAAAVLLYEALRQRS